MCVFLIGKRGRTALRTGRSVEETMPRDHSMGLVFGKEFCKRQEKDWGDQVEKKKEPEKDQETR